LARLTDRFAPASGIDPKEYLAEFFLTGWRESTSRCEAVFFRSDTSFEPARHVTKRGVTTLPPLPVDYIPPRLSAATGSEEMLVTLMLAEYRFFSDRHELVGAPRLGGEISITEITRDSVSTRMVQRFPDFDLDNEVAAVTRAEMCAATP